MKKKIVAALLTVAMMMPTSVMASTITGDHVNVRTSPSMNGAVVGQFNKGDWLDVHDMNVNGSGWAIATTPWGECYIKNDYIIYGTPKPSSGSVTNSAKPQDVWSAISGKRSATHWLIAVDETNCVCHLFEAGNGWQMIDSFSCAVGASGKTPHGTFQIEEKRPVLHSSGSDEYFFSPFTYDNGAIGFHSVLYNKGTYDVADGRLGGHFSNGCVRLPYEKSQWIYDNCGIGTMVVVF